MKLIVAGIRDKTTLIVNLKGGTDHEFLIHVKEVALLTLPLGVFFRA